jgi:hypothetical protein
MEEDNGRPWGGGGPNTKIWSSGGLTGWFPDPGGRRRRLEDKGKQDKSNQRVYFFITSYIRKIKKNKNKGEAKQRY